MQGFLQFVENTENFLNTAHKYHQDFADKYNIKKGENQKYGPAFTRNNDSHIMGIANDQHGEHTSLGFTLNHHNGNRHGIIQNIENVGSHPSHKGKPSSIVHDWLNGVKKLGVTHVKIAGNHAPAYWKHITSKHPDLKFQHFSGEDYK